MESTLKFNLEDQDDKQSHFRCIKSLDMACALHEISANSRKKVLNRIESKDAHIVKNNPDLDFILQLVFEEVGDVLEEHNLNIEELIT
mgnify:CR=1 FL=1